MSTEDARAVLYGLLFGAGFIALAFAAGVVVDRIYRRRDHRLVEEHITTELPS